MDRETSERLFETYYMKVYSYAMTLAKEQSLAEELTEEAFFKAMTAEKTFSGKSEEFTWLCAILKNLFYDEMRRRSRRAEAIPEELPDTASLPEEKVESEDTAFRIHLALHAMEEPYKEVFSLRVFGGLPFSKISAIFGKTETWARVTYHRAKLKIQERTDIR